MHYDLLVETQGVSLERISSENPSTDKNNWHSASFDVNYGTPGYKNSMTTDVIEIDDNNEINIVPEIFSPDNDGFDDICNIYYDLNENGYTINIKIFNSKGRLVNNLLNSITNKVDVITANILNICDTIKKYDEETIVTDISHFGEAANEIDRIIALYGQGVHYLNEYEARENEIILQLALYQSSGTPNFRVKITSDECHVKTNNGIYLQNNLNFATSNRYVLKNFDTHNTKVNEENWKPVNVYVASVVSPIEEILLTSDIPIVAISANLPNIKNSSIKNIVNDVSHLRSIKLKNVKNANGLLEDCTRLMNVDIDFQNCTDFNYCFRNCIDLVEVKNLNMNNATTCEGMFENCTSLQYITLDQNCISVPDGLDFSTCSSMKLNQMVSFLNSLPLADYGNPKTIYVPNVGISSAQISGFRNKGYRVVVK